MEDAHETVAHFDGDPSTSFFAVYDGHGGTYTRAVARCFSSADVVLLCVRDAPVVLTVADVPSAHMCMTAC